MKQDILFIMMIMNMKLMELMKFGLKLMNGPHMKMEIIRLRFSYMMKIGMMKIVSILVLI